MPSQRRILCLLLCECGEWYGSQCERMSDINSPIITTCCCCCFWLYGMWERVVVAGKRTTPYVLMGFCLFVFVWVHLSVFYRDDGRRRRLLYYKGCRRERCHVFARTGHALQSNIAQTHMHIYAHHSLFDTTASMPFCVKANGVIKKKNLSLFESITRRC